MPPGLPRPPRINLPSNPLAPLKQIAREGRERVEKAGSDIRSIADELHSTLHPQTPTRAPESPKESLPPPTENSSSLTTEAPQDSVSTGTACLPCCRDHLSTSSSVLSEGIRFARDKGVKDPQAIRRIRIALDELNAMERIDLAPDEIVKLKGAERELADWVLKSSRDLRHAITAIKDIGTMEQAAAKTSSITEEFMSRLWAIPEEECETCGEVRESIRQFIEKRKSVGGER